MDEILWELREHSAGLNAGRWDYMFSVIKKFRDAPRVRPSRPEQRDHDGALHARLHRAARPDLPPPRRARDGRHGGLHPEPQGPRAERARAGEGDATTSAARPATASTAPGSRIPTSCPSAREEFDRVLGERPNQLDRQRPEVSVAASDLLDVPSTPGEVTEEGLRNDVSVGIQYLSAWLRGSGAVAIYNLMEDAATAEIARSQVWQWLRHGRFEPEDARAVIDEELERLRARLRRRGLRQEPRRRGARHLRAGRARRGLRRVPDPARLRLPGTKEQG